MSGIQLTPAQQAALEAEGDVLVAAAAGSGKTRVLSERIVRAVLDQQIPVSAVVAVTFTDQAAEEIRHRVGSRLTAAGRLDLVGQLDGAPIGTIHSLCSRILRRFASRVGVDPGFAILDTAQVAWLRRRAFHNVVDAASGDDAIVDMRARLGDHRVESTLLSTYDAVMQLPDPTPHFGERRDGAALQWLYTRWLAEYERLCRRAGGVDFDALQQLAWRAVREEDVALELRADVQRLLVDEYQDTNPLQVALLERIGEGCLFAVGDEWQSIYRFRRADVRGFRRRSADERVRQLPLRDNFRSAHAVIDVVNHAFTRAFGDRYAPVVAARAVPGATDRPACTVLAVESPRGKADEAQVVAREIRRLLDDGVDPAEVAVLLPQQSSAAQFEQALAQLDVPTLRVASSGYFLQRPVRDVVSLLAWAWRPEDDRAALAVLSSPLATLPWGTLLRLRRSAPTMWEAVTASDEPRCVEVAALVRRLRAVAQDESLVEVVEHAVHRSRLATLAARGRHGRRTYANLRKLVELAEAATRVGIDDIGRFLELVGAQRAHGTEGEASIADDGVGAVRIMTVHRSKGLEFSHVFVADLGSSGSTRQAELLVDDGGVVAWYDPDAPEDGEHAARLDEQRAREATELFEEQQRLLYVALTRARERLWLSGTWRRSSRGAPILRGPMKWLFPLLDVDVDELVGGSGTLDHPQLALHAAIVRAGELPPARERTRPPRRVELPGRLVGGLDLPAQPDGAPDRSDGAEVRTFAELRAQRTGSVDENATRAGIESHRQLATRLARPDAPVDPALEPVVRSATFQQLVAAGARAEVPFLHGTPHGVRAGRFDAVAVRGSQWWIVDFKTSVPESASATWALHAEQLQGYVDAAFAAGAQEVRLTVLGTNRPDEPHEWRVREPATPAFSDDAVQTGGDGDGTPSAQLRLL